MLDITNLYAYRIEELAVGIVNRIVINKKKAEKYGFRIVIDEEN